MKKSPLVWMGTIVAGLLLGIISVGAHRVAPEIREQHSVRLQLTSTNAHVRNPKNDLIGAALTALAGRPDLQGLARLGEVLPLLDGKAIRELLDRLERISRGIETSQLEWLFFWLLTQDKEAATAWITPRLLGIAQDGPRGPLFPRSGLGKMFEMWAEAEPDQAIAFARKYPDRGIAEQLLTAAIRKLAKDDKAQGMSVLLEFPPGRARTSALASVLTEWAKQDPSAAFSTACGLEPGEARDSSIGVVLSQWSDADASAALENYYSIGMNDPAVLATVLTGFARQDPASAVAALEGMSSQEFLRCSPRVAVEWAKQDPAAALSWLMERNLNLGKSVEVEDRVAHQSLRRIFTTYEWMIGSPLHSAFEAQPDATLAWLRSLPPGADRDEAYELAASASPTAETALELFAELPTEAAARAAYDIASRFARDPAVGQRWVEGLPPGPVRQQAFAGFGESGLGVEPKRAEDRDAFLSGRLRSPNTHQMDLREIIKINDPVLRKDLFEMAFDDFRGTAVLRDRMIFFIEEAGLSEEWKRRLLD